MTISVYIEPYDVLLFRGNRLFREPGSYAETMHLPWPSVASGAIRSALLVQKGIKLIARVGWYEHDSELGTPKIPGTFTLTGWQLARRYIDGNVERIYSLPADLVVTKENDKIIVRRLKPIALNGHLKSSYQLPKHPVIAERDRSKPESGFWLSQSGWQLYLEGKDIPSECLIKSSDLWQVDLRVGVGLASDKRTADEGKLFTIQALTPRKHWTKKDSKGFDVGYVADITGVAISHSFSIRLGGDGRGAQATLIQPSLPYIDYQTLLKQKRCKIVLMSPGIFPCTDMQKESSVLHSGWLPTGTLPEQKREDGAIRFSLHGVSGWIVSAAVPRFEVISGWDIARCEPKPALRAAPTGSVYWIELDESVSVNSLSKLVQIGLWTDDEYNKSLRRPEGFNRLALATWS